MSEVEADAYSKRSFKEGNVTVKQDEDVFFDIKV